MKTLIVSLVLLIAAYGTSSAQGFVINGMMRHTTIEGGCWYLNGDDGKHYELYGDSAIIAPLHVEGEHATLRVERMKGAASICMIGEMVKVLAREDKVRYPQDPMIMPMSVHGTMQEVDGKWRVKTAHGYYEFQTPPAAKYRHAGAKFRQRVNVLMNTGGPQSGLQGTILPVSAPKQSNAKMAKPDDAR